MAGNKYLALDPTTSLPKEVAATQSSSGTASAGQIPALNSAGQLDSTMMPTGVGEASISLPTSENLAAGALVNIYSNAGTVTVRNANAADATKPAQGFVTAAVTAPAAATVWFPNQLVSGLSGLTVGPVFLSASTPGGAASTAPSAAGNLVQPIGWAVSATEILFDPAPGIIHG